MRPAARWAAAAAYAAAIFALSSIEDLASPASRVPHAEKFAHALVYFFFAGTLAWALVGSGVRRVALICVLLAAAYGATDEIHQHFVQGRTMSFFDWVADAAGAALWPLAGSLARRRGATPPRQSREL